MKVLNYGSGMSIYDMSCFGPVHNFIEVKTIDNLLNDVKLCQATVITPFRIDFASLTP